MIVDSHCHLDFKELNQNLENILREAENNNISYMQTICTKISTFDKVKEIAQSHKNIFCSVGIHPNDIQTEKLCDHQTLVNYTKHPKVISSQLEVGYFYYEKTRALVNSALSIRTIGQICGDYDVGRILIVYL